VSERSTRFDRAAEGETPRSPGGRHLRMVVALAAMPYLTGCYEYAPVGSVSPGTGADLSVQVTDRGRIALEPQVGPEVRRINGRLLESSDTSLALSVRSVTTLRSNLSQPWSGERIAVSRNYISEIGARRLSKPRTAFMAGLLVAAAVAVSTIGIAGFGGGDASDQPGGGGEPGEQ
jgi:hypothetical protein